MAPLRPRCTVKGCRRQHHAKGMCRLHYYRQPDKVAKAAKRAKKKSYKQKQREYKLIHWTSEKQRRSYLAWLKSSKGQAFKLKLRWLYNNDPTYRGKVKEAEKRYLTSAKGRQAKRRWLYETEAGKVFRHRRSLRLPKTAPAELIKALDTLRQLKKEKRRGHQ